MFEIRYGTPGYYKSVKMYDYDRAAAFYEKVKRFADHHRLSWTISLWNRGWLVKSETINL